MYDQHALLTDLDASLARQSSEWRAVALKKLTALFVAGSQHFSAEHVALYDLVLPRFVDAVAEHTLVGISTALSELRNAPPLMAERLARHKNAAVAGPMLEKSAMLSEACLMDLVGSAGPDLLIAIARRPKISTAVSDAIFERQNRPANFHLICNQGAAISEMGYVKMIDEAQRDATLARAIRARTDIPEELRPFFEMLDKPVS